jgi:hypothetical protein
LVVPSPGSTIFNPSLLPPWTIAPFESTDIWFPIQTLHMTEWGCISVYFQSGRLSLQRWRQNHGSGESSPITWGKRFLPKGRSRSTPHHWSYPARFSYGSVSMIRCPCYVLLCSWSSHVFFFFQRILVRHKAPCPHFLASTPSLF